MIKRKKFLKQQLEAVEGETVDDHFNDFHEAFAPPKINKVLEQLFTMLKNSEVYG